MDAIAQGLYARAKLLLNNDLKRICKEEGRVQSGNKAQLQERVIASMLHNCSRHALAAAFRKPSLTYRLHI
jgi:E3 SUMO-protein ligase PIAS1